MLEHFGAPEVLLRALERVRARESARGSTEALLEGGPSLTSLSHELPALLARVGALVRAGQYEFTPLELRHVRIAGKERLLFHGPPLDVVVQTAVAQVLASRLDAALSPRVFSYRRGYAPKRALFELSAFVRQHRAARPDPKTRGLYIARRDVTSYGNSIPSGPDAQLWQLLRTALEEARLGFDEAAFRWLMSAVRPQVRGDWPEGRGVPTGSPLQPLMNNLYLRALDRDCEREAGFYARFGDDLLYAHHDPAHVVEMAERMDASLVAHGLLANERKSALLYLTAAGRSADDARFRATSSFTYLGMRVDGHGQVGLGQEKSTRFLRDVSRRLLHTRALSQGLDSAARARLFCAIANAAWDPRSAVNERATSLLRDVVTDRAQLTDLDHQLALRVAEAVSGRRGVKAFRVVSPHELRALGLRSLVAARNRRGDT